MKLNLRYNAKVKPIDEIFVTDATSGEVELMSISDVLMVKENKQGLTVILTSNDPELKTVGTKVVMESPEDIVSRLNGEPDKANLAALTKEVIRERVSQHYIFRNIAAQTYQKDMGKVKLAYIEEADALADGIDKTTDRIGVLNRAIRRSAFYTKFEALVEKNEKSSSIFDKSKLAYAKATHPEYFKYRKELQSLRASLKVDEAKLDGLPQSHAENLDMMGASLCSQIDRIRQEMGSASLMEIDDIRVREVIDTHKRKYTNPSRIQFAKLEGTDCYANVAPKGGRRLAKIKTLGVEFS